MRVFGKRYISIIASDAGVCRLSESCGKTTQIKMLQRASDYGVSIVATVQIKPRLGRAVKDRAAELLKGTRVFGEWYKVTPETAVAAMRIAVIEKAAAFEPEVKS